EAAFMTALVLTVEFSFGSAFESGLRVETLAVSGFGCFTAGSFLSCAPLLKIISDKNNLQSHMARLGERRRQILLR
ncbi:hypothetical protein BKA70DRAFT_1301560, partial [Coprinopsis sp. MPI-PUGE-AT-0042]